MHLADLLLGPGDTLLLVDAQLRVDAPDVHGDAAASSPLGRAAARFREAGLPVVAARRPPNGGGSAFAETDLKQRLREVGAVHVFIAGVFPDWSALVDTVRDAIDRDFTVSLLLDGVYAAETQPGERDRSLAEALAIGALPVEIGPHGERPPAESP